MKTDMLVCPVTKQGLRITSVAEAERLAGGPLKAVTSQRLKASRPLDQVLLCQDNLRAYPILDGIPVLMAPLMLIADNDLSQIDLDMPQYGEVLEEIEHYDEKASEALETMDKQSAIQFLFPGGLPCEVEKSAFPRPFEKWVDAVYDCLAQFEAYVHLSPLGNKRMLQMGGSGTHAVKFLLGGAADAWLLTPMLEEAFFAKRLAQFLGVEDRLSCVLGIAEEIPFRDEVFEGVYSGGCVHHTVTSLAAPEIARVIRSRGRFAAVDPWKAPLYKLGTSVFGKREEDVNCHPMTAERVKPFAQCFKRTQLMHHGSFMRYPLLALDKMGVGCRLPTARRLMDIDDVLASFLRLRGIGSSLALLCDKE